MRLGVTGRTYDGRDSKLLLTSILEESQDIIANDDTRLSAQNISDTHFDKMCSVGRRELNCA